MSSILEKLLIFIQLDATDVKKGADDVEKSTNKIDHSFDETGRHSELLGHLVHHLRRELTGFVFSLLGVGAALEGIHKTFDYFNKLSGASDLLQVNVEELDAWNEAIIKVGGTAEGFDESIKKVAEHFHTTNAIALKVLPQLAGLFQHLSKTQSLEYGKKIGIDEPTIQLLQRGRHEVEAVIATQKKLGVITSEQKDKLDKFNAAWADTKQQLRLVTFEAELALLPALTKVIKFLGETINYLGEHPAFVKSFLVSMATMTIAVKIFGKTVNNAGKASALGWIEILGPIGAVSAAIGLVIDDWEAFKNKNASVIEEINKKWPAAGAVIIGVFSGVEKLIKGFINDLELVFKTLEKIIKLKVHVSNAPDEQSKIIHSWFRSNKKNQIKHLDLAKSQIAIASSIPLIPRSLDNNSSKKISISIGDININTQATDAAGISTAIGKGLYDHLFQLTSNFDDGQVA